MILRRRLLPLLSGEGAIFPSLSGEDKGGVSFILSPSQGETQKGFQLVETSPQPSPERRGRSISSHLRGRIKEGGFLCNLSWRALLRSNPKRSHPPLRGSLRSACKRSNLSWRALLRSNPKRSHLLLLKTQAEDLPACHAAAQAGGYERKLKTCGRETCGYFRNRFILKSHICSFNFELLQ